MTIKFQPEFVIHLLLLPMSNILLSTAHVQKMLVGIIIIIIIDFIA